MKAIYLNVKEGKNAEVVDIKDDLETFYKLLDCDTIDIPTKKIGTRYFSIICDDEGLLKSGAKISAIDKLNNLALVGNLLVVSADNDNGELVGLTDEQIDYIMQRVRKINTRLYPEGYYMLTDLWVY